MFISELFESSNDFLWHGSRDRITVLTPQQAEDTGGNPKSNKKAIYATADKNFAIAMGLTTRGSDTAGFPNDPQLVLFSGKIRHGQLVYLHKLPMYDANGRPLFEPGGNDREFTSVPGVTELKPIEVEEVPVDQHLNLIRQPTPKDLELKKYYLQRAKRAKRGVNENQSVSTKDMINYIRKHHDNNLHSDYTSYIANTFTGFELQDVSVNSLRTNLPKLDQAKVEQYKTMDFSKAPPIVVGDGNILDGYHRANVAKALGIPTIRAYVGIKGVTEVTLVPTVAKSKRQHLDVMPNDGRPIPPGDEEHYLGKFVARMPGGYELWGWDSRWDRTYCVFDPETRISQLATTGKQYPENPNSFIVAGLYSGPKNQVRAADLYAFLIKHLGLTLVSDNKQSEGGYRVWKELERRYGKTINVHGFDTRTNKGVNVTTQDEPDTHVDRATVKRAGPQMKRELGTISRDLRFVASAK